MNIKLIAVIVSLIAIYLFMTRKNEGYTDYHHHAFITDNYNYLYNTFDNLSLQTPKYYWKQYSDLNDTLYDKEIKDYLYDWHSPDLL